MSLALSYVYDDGFMPHPNYNIDPVTGNYTPVSDPRFMKTDAFGGSAGFDYSVNPLAALASGVPQIGDDAMKNPGTSLLELISRGLQIYQLDRQQKAFLEINRERLRQGLNPIGWDQFQPTASVGVALDSDTKRMLWILGAGALGLLAIMALRR